MDPDALGVPDPFIEAPSAAPALLVEGEEDFEALFQKWKSEGDPKVREQLILMHMNLVRYLARKFKDRGEPLDDLLQQGIIGLINAIDRFDLDRGVKFSTYATPTILGEIRRYFRDKGWSMKVPRRLQELNLLANRAIEELTQELDRSPTYHEIAAALNAPEDEVIEALEMSQAYDLVSLDSEIGPMDEDADAVLADRVGQEDPNLEMLRTKSQLEDAVSVLDPRERRVINLAYYSQMSQTEIAGILGISQMHVSRIQRKALTKMQQHLEEVEHGRRQTVRPTTGRK